MKTDYKVQKENDLTKSLISFVIAFVTIAMAASCEKQELDVIEPMANISLNLTKANYFDTKDRAEYCQNLKPVKAIMETDKGNFEFRTIDIPGGYLTEKIGMAPDKYRILKVRLYDNEGNVTHLVYENKPSNNGSIVVPWVHKDLQAYDLTKDRDIVFQIFCN